MNLLYKIKGIHTLFITLFISLFAILLITPQAKALKSYELDMINIYNKVSPSVVSVFTVTFEYDYWDIEPIPRRGAGSGVVIDNQGHILTNYHVIEGADKINIAFGDTETVYNAVLIGSAPENDLAVLKVNAPKNLLIPAKLGNSSNLKVGQSVVAIGNPFGILGRTMTTGIISAVGRDISIGNKSLSRLIQTDAAINSGNSGGPLVNTDMQVIGINTMILSKSGGSVGIGFAIPINVAKNILPDLISKGKVIYPWLGVNIQAIDANVAKLLKLPVKQGLLVMNTVKGAPANKYGIVGGNRKVIINNTIIPVGGDIIIAIDSKKMNSGNELVAYLRTKRVGEIIKVKILRGDNFYDIPIKLEGQPDKITN